MCLADWYELAVRSSNAMGKAFIHYKLIEGTALVGGYVRVIPVDHYVKGLNGCNIMVGPVTGVLERVNDSRPVFTTAYAVFLPDDMKRQNGASA